MFDILYKMMAELEEKKCELYEEYFEKLPHLEIDESVLTALSDEIHDINIKIETLGDLAGKLAGGKL